MIINRVSSNTEELIRKNTLSLFLCSILSIFCVDVLLTVSNEKEGRCISLLNVIVKLLLSSLSCHFSLSPFLKQTYKNTYTHTHTNTHARTSTNKHKNTHTHTHAQAQKHTHTHPPTHTLPKEQASNKTHKYRKRNKHSTKAVSPLCALII